MKSFFQFGQSAALAMLVAAPAWLHADDSDIYLNSSALSVGTPRVMLTLDFRSNVGSTLCTDATSASCEATMGDVLYPEMDLISMFDPVLCPIVKKNINDIRGADGTPDDEQVDPCDATQTLKQSYWRWVSDVNLYDALRTVLRVVLNQVAQQVIDDDAIDKIEVGFMVSHESGGGSGCSGTGPTYTNCSEGAYILKGFTDITNDAYLDDLLIRIAAIPEPGLQAPWMKNSWNGHSYKVRDIYLEFYRYITGKEVYSAFLGYNDYNSQVSSKNLDDLTNDVLINLYDGNGDQPLLEPDTSIMNASKKQYISPLDPSEDCSAFYMINGLFGSTGNSDSSTNTEIAKAYSSGGLNLTLSGGQDEADATLVAKFEATDFGATEFGFGSDVAGTNNVTSYFIADKVRKNTNAMAAGGGTGTAIPLTDPQAALEALTNIFNEILSVSTTFVAASIPTNVFNRSQVVDNIYFALFAAEKEPRWSGNVKKLKVAELTSNDPNVPVELVIAQAPLTDPPVSAISSQDGRIRTNALTFWTDTSGADVLAFDADAGESAGTDGRSITRGGSAQKIPGYLSGSVGLTNSAGPRKVYTQNPAGSSLLALDDGMDVSGVAPYLDPDNTLATDANRWKLIRWIRGMDAYDLKDADGDDTETRDWLMMDPMHSRPLVINYGKREGSSYTTESNPDIRLFFGTNDGVFRSIVNTTPGDPGTESGAETFAFVPLELLSMQYTLSQNIGQSAPPHPYGMDGEAVSYVYDKDFDGNIENTSDGDYVWVFVGQRRGGKGLYAFDMTNPDSPTFKWKITDATAGFEQLALTFSTPQTTALDLGGTSLTPVLIFSGGYNGGWNGTSRVGKDAGDAADDIGNAIYVVNADTGDLIWKGVGPGPASAGVCADTAVDPLGGSVSTYCLDGKSSKPTLEHSIPSTISIVDSDNNNVIDRAYVGDSGGNVWRIELTEDTYKSGTHVTSDWYVTKIAALGGTGSNDRRFFHAPDFVKTKDAVGDYDAVIITSGDRASPTETTGDNFAYMIKDRNTVTNGPAVKSATTLVPTDIVDITDICITGAEAACDGANVSTGWRLELEASGEKGLSKPLVNSGVIAFTTYLPNGGTASDVCSPSEGEGRVYLVNLSDGSVFNDLEADLITDKADRYTDIGPGIPGDVIPYEDQILIPGKGIGGKQIVSIPGRSLWRVYWREEEIDQL